MPKCTCKAEFGHPLDLDKHIAIYSTEEQTGFMFVHVEATVHPYIVGEKII